MAVERARKSIPGAALGLVIAGIWQSLQGWASSFHAFAGSDLLNEIATLEKNYYKRMEKTVN